MSNPTIDKLISTIFKTLKDSIYDISIVGETLTRVNALKLDATNISGYATALKGLSINQAELVLSTKGLTVAQQQAVLAKAELLGVTGKLTTAELNAILVNKKRSKDQAESLLIKTGLITAETSEATATNVVTAAKLKELVQTKALTQAEADLIAAKAGIISTNAKEASSFALFGDKFKSFGNSLLAIGKAHPILAVISIAIGAITTAVTIAEKKNEEFIESQEKLIEKIDENISKYDEEISSLSSLQEKLQDAKGDKKALASIQSELNSAIGNTPDLLNEESNAYDIANQKINDRIERLKELRKLELNDKVTAQKEIFDNTLVDNNWGIDHKFDYFSNHKIIASDTLGSEFDDYLKGINVNKFETLQSIFETLKKNGYGNGEKSNAEIWKELIDSYGGAMLDVEEIQNYFDNQTEYAQKILSDYVNNSESIFSEEELNSIIEDLIESGYSQDLEGIKSIITSLVENDELETIINDYYESLYNDDIDSDALYQNIKSQFDTLVANYPELKEILENYFNNIGKDVEIGIDNATQNSDTSSPTFIDKLSTEDYEDISKELKTLAEAGELTPNTLTSTKEYNALLKETNTSAQEATEQLYNMIDANERLATFSSNMGNVDKAYAEFKTNGFNTIDTLSSMQGAFGDLDYYNKFIKIAGDAKSSTEQIQEAYNKLVTEYVYSIGILDTVNESNRGMIQTQLEQLGITNAEEIVTKALNNEIMSLSEAKAILAQYGYDLNTVTSEEINKLIHEGKVSNTTAEQIATLALKKKLANGATIKTDGDIANLVQLANVSADVVDMLFKVANIKERLESGVAEAGTASGRAWLESEIANYNKKINKHLNKKQKTNIDYTGGTATTDAIEKANKKSTKSTTKFSQAIDWCTQTLSKLGKSIDLFSAKLESNTNSVKTQIKYYKQLLNAQNNIIKGYAKTEKKYNKKYQNSLSKLSDEDRKKVEDGTYTIEQFKGKAKSGKKSSAEKRYNNIQDALESRDNLLDAQVDLVNAQNQFEEYAEALVSVRWEKATEKVEKLNGELDLLELKASNAVGSLAKNSLVDEQLANQKASVKKQRNALKKTQFDADSVYSKISSKYKKNTKTDGTIKTKGITDKKQLSYIKLYNAYVKELADDTLELTKAEEEYKSAQREAILTKAENIQSEYDMKMGQYETKQNRIQDKIALAEAQGKIIGKAYYTSMIASAQKSIPVLEAEMKELQQHLTTINPNTNPEEWYEVAQQISECSSNMDNLKASTEEWNTTMQEIETSAFDDLIAKFQKLNDEADFYIELLENSGDLFDENGNMTDLGNAKLGLLYSNYLTSQNKGDVAGKKAERFSSYLSEAEANGSVVIDGVKWTVDELEDKITSLKETQQDAISSMYDYKDTILDLIEEGINVEIEATEELIEKKKEALESERELDDFRKKVADSNQDIALIERQLSALEGDNSDEARKKRRELEAQKSDAEENRQELLKEQAITMQTDSLDEALEQFEADMEAYLETVKTDLSSVSKIVNNNLPTISGTLKNVLGKIEYIADKDISFIIDTNNGTVEKNTNTVTKGYETEATNEQKKAEEEATQNITTVSTEPATTSTVSNALDNANEQSKLNAKILDIIKSGTKTKKSEADDKKANGEYKYRDVNRYLIKKYGYRINQKKQTEIARLLGMTGATEDNITNIKKQIKLLEKLKLTGFSTGGMVKVDDLNSIVKANGDDGIATVKKDEYVLTPVQTQSFIDLAKLSPDLLQASNTLIDGLKFNPTIPLASGTQLQNIDNSVNIQVQGNADATTVKDIRKIAEDVVAKQQKEIQRQAYNRGMRLR